jgi:esterase
MRLHSHTIGSGPNMIILHGLFGSHHNWQPVARQLSGQFRVHTVDLRNHGASPHHDEVNYPVMAADVLKHMDGGQIPNAHLLGHSLGGKVAMQFALLHPDRVRKLMIVDIAPRAYESVHEEVFDALNGLRLAGIRTRAEADEALAAGIPDQATRRFLLTNLISLPGGGFRWRVNLEALYAQQEQLTAAVTGKSPFTGPALFLRGSRSQYIQETDRRNIETLFPHARIQTIESAGHWIHVDAPEAFLAGIIEFLKADPG